MGLNFFETIFFTTFKYYFTFQNSGTFLRSRTQTHNTFVLLAVKSNNPLTHRISLHTRKKQKNRYMYYWKWMMMFFFCFAAYCVLLLLHKIKNKKRWINNGKVFFFFFLFFSFLATTHSISMFILFISTG